MRGPALVLAIAAVGAVAVAFLIHSRRGTVDRQLDADLAAALDRGGLADLGRAQAVGRRLVLGSGSGRAEAAALAFADARLALDCGLGTAVEAAEILGRFGLPDGRQDAASAMAGSAKAMLAARAGDRDAAIRLAAETAAAVPGAPQPLYALGRARALAGDLGGAARAFDAATVVSPAFLASLVARAEVFLDLGNAAGARAALETVLAQSAGDARAQLLLAEVDAAAPAPGGAAKGEPPACAPDQWRPPAIEAACALARAGRARRVGDRALARTEAEAAARAIPEEPRLLARAALLLADLGAVDRAAALLARTRRIAAPETPTVAWAAAAIALGRGRARALPPDPRPANPETALVVARAALAAGGVLALGEALRELGPAARARDADLDRLGRLVSHAPPNAHGDDPMQAYVDGLAAQLDGNLAGAAEHFAHALSGHGDACRTAGEYVAALRAQKLRPSPGAFVRLRDENAHCVNLR